MNKNLNKPKVRLFLVFLLATVVVSAVAGLAVNKIFGRPQEVTNINEFMPNELTLGSSFTLDEVVDFMGYESLWVKTNAVEVHLLARKSGLNLEESEELISYSPDDRTFYISGVGVGEIQIYSVIDKTVCVSFSYETKFRSADTEGILKENYPRFFDDNVITAKELQTVEKVSLRTEQNVDLLDLAFCPSLKRVVFGSTEGIVSAKNLDRFENKACFFVPDDLYYDYIADETWNAQYERIFPTVDLSDDRNIIVYEFNGGSMPKIGMGKSYYFTSVVNGSTIITADYVVTKTGHAFLGWYLSEDRGITGTTEITDTYVFENCTKLYANWQAHEYDVRYNDKYGVAVPDTRRVTYEQQFCISDVVPVREGYTFLGWATQENSKEVVYFPGASVERLSSIHNGVVDLYAVWTANNYGITYNANGGSNAPEGQNDLTYGEDVQLSTQIPERTGYVFLGWSTAPDDVDFMYAAGAIAQNITSDAEGVATLYAVWAANTYSIVYDANGGSAPPMTQEGLSYGDVVVLSDKTPKKNGYVFKGWSTDPFSTDPQYLSGAVLKNLGSGDGDKITLYAVWEPKKFYLFFDANGGGTDVPAKEILTFGLPYSLSEGAPTKVGHSFKGWSLSPDGAIFCAQGGALSASQVTLLYGKCIEERVTFYAVWQVNKYTVTVKTSGGSVSGVTNGTSYAYGTPLTIVASYSYNDNRYMKFDGTVVSDTYSFNMPAKDITIEVYSKDNCIAAGSMITLADGTQKKVEDLLETDALLVFDHETGTCVSTPILFIERDGWKEYNVIHLVFSNGQITKVIGEHAFFDLTLNQYVYIDEGNYATYVGHRFVTYDVLTGENSYRTLENAYVEVEYTGCYSLITAYHMNYFVDDLFSLPGGINGLFNIFAYGDNMAYDAESMKNDVVVYGLYTYEDFEDYVSYEIFEYMFPAKYFKVAVGKGMITFEEILGLIDFYLVKHGLI